MIDSEFDPQEFLRKWKQAQRRLPELMTESIDEGMKHIQDEVPAYPRASRKPFIFVSEKQRRYVMAAIRDGRIEIPYRRTGSGGIGGSINTEVRKLGSDIVGVIGSNKVYAPYVIDEDRQAAYHEGTWWTLQKVVRDSIADFIKIVARNVLRFLE